MNQQPPFTQNQGYRENDPYYGGAKRRSAAPWIIGIAVALVVILCVSCIIGIFTSDEMQGTGMVTDLSDAYNYIGVLHIEGTIASATDTSLLYTSSQVYSQEYVLSCIEQMKEDDENRGILLYINSPGGEMYAGDDVYQALMEYKEETRRPVYAYFAETAASGGYYIAMAADEIYAHRMTLTGSIGVTYGTHIDLSGLCEKLGITTEELTSGDNKAMGSYFSPLTEEQREIYLSMLTEYEGYFVDVIVEGRDLPRDKVEALADGRVFTATQALEHDLIDGICSYDDYLAAVEEDFEDGVEFVDLTFYMDYEDLLTTYVDSLASLPSSEIAAVLATIKPLNGPLMYYSGH